MKHFKCLDCGRDKFTGKQRHHCRDGFRKANKCTWEVIDKIIEVPQSQKNIEALKALYKELDIKGCSF